MTMHEFDAREVTALLRRAAPGTWEAGFAPRMAELLIRWGQSDGPEDFEDNQADTIALLNEIAREWSR